MHVTRALHYETKRPKLLFLGSCDIHTQPETLDLVRAVLGALVLFNNLAIAPAQIPNSATSMEGMPSELKSGHSANIASQPGVACFLPAAEKVWTL